MEPKAPEDPKTSAVLLAAAEAVVEVADSKRSCFSGSLTVRRLLKNQLIQEAPVVRLDGG
jgi:hypothetical protein